MTELRHRGCDAAFALVLGSRAWATQSAEEAIIEAAGDGMNRRDFIVVLGTAAYSSLGFAEEPRRQHKLAIIDPSASVEEMHEADLNPNWRMFFYRTSSAGLHRGYKPHSTSVFRGWPGHLP